MRTTKMVGSNELTLIIYCRFRESKAIIQHVEHIALRRTEELDKQQFRRLKLCIRLVLSSSDSPLNVYP